MELAQLSAAQILKKLDDREFSAVECINYFQNRIREYDPKLNAFTAQTDSEALKAAERIDEKRAAGETDNLPLAGLPVALKDNICTSDVTTTAGSKILDQFVPFYDATVASKLKRAGAILIGKTMLDEFAMGGSTENPHYGATRNPWAQDRVPGGSSGGSAAAVAAGMTPISLGSDTGGSIRQPAAFCGVTGLKPTYGRVSRFGLIAYGSSLDQIGPITHTAKDAAIVMNAIGGHDTQDSTSINQPIPDFNQALTNDLEHLDRPLRIGVCREHFSSALDSEIEKAIRESIQVFQNLGAEIVDISIPHSDYAVEAYYLVASCEASSNLSRFDGAHYTKRMAQDSLVAMYEQTRAECFGPEVQHRIMLGTFALSSGYFDQYYVRASKVRRLIKQDFENAFANDADVILGPTTPTAAYGIGEKTRDPIAMYQGDIYTVAANLAGIPSISVPCGITENGLPIGMQLQTSRLNDANLLNIAHVFQQHTDWHNRRPSL